MATGWIVLAQVVSLQLIAATITNIAYGKKPSMSSNQHGGYYARRAVDGNTNAVYPEGIINTGTGQNTAWWKVDMVTCVQDATVKIYFRTDYKKRRNGVQLYTSTTPFSMYPSGHLCHTFTGRADGTDIPNVVSVNCTGTWRYLMVYTQTENDGLGAVLDFGEVEVLACSIGTYGPDCTKSCRSRQCAVTPTSCYRYTAACPDGRCKTGWTGSDCTEECPVGTCGINCSYCSMRHCEGESGCPTDGTCSNGCQDGWTLPSCTQVCLQGRYGANCEKNCGHCVGTCDGVDGHCPSGCVYGYSGTQCNTLKAPSTGPDPVTIAVTATVVIGFMFVVGGLTLFCLIRFGRLRWVSAADEPAEMDDFTNTQVTSQTQSEHAQPDSLHMHNNDYALLDAETKSNNTAYDVIKSRDYENT